MTGPDAGPDSRPAADRPTTRPMEAVAELRVLLASGQSLITVATTEEARLLAIVRDAGGDDAVLDVVGRERAVPRRRGAGVRLGRRPGQALDDVAALAGPWTVVLCDPAPLLAEPTAVRHLKELAQRATPGQTLVLVGAQLAVPPELDGLARAWALPAPTGVGAHRRGRAGRGPGASSAACAPSCPTATACASPAR